MTGQAGQADRSRVTTALVHYEGPLLRYALRLTGNADVAREVVQDTFVRFFERKSPATAESDTMDVRAMTVPPIEADRNGHAPWLFAVCRNRAIDVMKRRRLVIADQSATSEAAPAVAPPPGLALERADEHERVLRLLAALPQRQQEVVRLKFQAGLSYKEIGEVLDLSATNVGFLIHVALKALRERLRET
jgi:RNA polymerase sigma-70 factor (ECF subfamily)